MGAQSNMLLEGKRMRDRPLDFTGQAMNGLGRRSEFMASMFGFRFYIPMLSVGYLCWASFAQDSSLEARLSEGNGFIVVLNRSSGKAEIHSEDLPAP